MEASMHGPFDKSAKDQANIYKNWSMKLFALPLLLAIALIGYVVSHPDIVKWVADGIQAELAGTHAAPDPTASTRVAAPNNQAHGVSAH
jgi:hypothetical protein